MNTSPRSGRIVLDSIDPLLALFTARGVSLVKTGTSKGAGSYGNSNTTLDNCDAFTLTAGQGADTYTIARGASITFYRPPSYSGSETLCLILDSVGQRSFTITGKLVCKIRDTRPAHQPSVSSSLRALSF